MNEKNITTTDKGDTGSQTDSFVDVMRNLFNSQEYILLGM